MDAFNSVYSTTYEVDASHGTNYHYNFKKFLRRVQDNNLTVVGAMTDSKGAKVHQTGICNSHEVLVMPTIAMGPDDRDYAVLFSVPVDSKGIIMIVERFVLNYLRFFYSF
jgi:4-hydroxybutyryl-CoA dehydratase/vinylacetyl-CoA-Delta-isomerase